MILWNSLVLLAYISSLQRTPSKVILIDMILSIWLLILPWAYSRYTDACMCAKLLHLCWTLRDAMDCSLPDSSVHGILQARIVEWVAIPFSRRSSWLRDQTQVSCFAGRFFTIRAREAPDIITTVSKKTHLHTQIVPSGAC